VTTTQFTGIDHIDALIRGRDHLKKVGLTKKNYFAAGVTTEAAFEEFASVPCCAEGALLVGFGPSLPPHGFGFTSDPAFLRADRYLDAAAIERCGNNVVIFNDLPATTTDDVVAVFDRAIELALADDVKSKK
jgi:hypothetical protein